MFNKIDIERVKSDTNYRREQISNTEKQMFWVVNLFSLALIIFLIIGDTIKIIEGIFTGLIVLIHFVVFCSFYVEQGFKKTFSSISNVFNIYMAGFKKVIGKKNKA